MFHPADYALTLVCHSGASLILAGSLGACKGLATACHLWPDASADPDAIRYTGAHPSESAEIYPVHHAGAGPWRIRLPKRLVEEGLTAPDATCVPGPAYTKGGRRHA